MTTSKIEQVIAEDAAAQAAVPTPAEVAAQQELDNNALMQEFLKREADSGNTTEATTSRLPGDTEVAPETPTTAPVEVEGATTTAGTTAGNKAEAGAGTDSETDDNFVNPLIPTEDGLPPLADDEGGGSEQQEPVVQPIVYNGQTFEPAVMESMIAVHQWANQLPEGAAPVIDAALSGEYVLVPRAEYEAQQATRGTTTPPTVNDGLNGLPPAADLDLEYVDPAVKAHLDQLNQTVQQQQQALSQFQQQQVAQQQQVLVERINSGLSTFAQEKGLQPAEAELLMQRLASMQMLPHYTRINNNDPEAGTKAALEALYWQDPLYRQRELDRQLEAARQEATATATRQRKAASLASSGGSVGRTEPPVTKDDRNKAMASEIAAAMNGS